MFSFTVGMFVRLTEGRSGWQMLACQPSCTADRYVMSDLYWKIWNSDEQMRIEILEKVGIQNRAHPLFLASRLHCAKPMWYNVRVRLKGGGCCHDAEH